MKINLLPNTSYGKWSARFLVAFLGLYVLSIIIVSITVRQVKETVYMDPTLSPFLAVSGILALLSGISSCVFGILSIIKQKERSVLAFLSVFIGGLALLFVLGEILLPH